MPRRVLVPGIDAKPFTPLWKQCRIELQHLRSELLPIGLSSTGWRFSASNRVPGATMPQPSVVLQKKDTRHLVECAMHGVGVPSYGAPTQFIDDGTGTDSVCRGSSTRGARRTRAAIRVGNGLCGVIGYKSNVQLLLLMQSTTDLLMHTTVHAVTSVSSVDCGVERWHKGVSLYQGVRSLTPKCFMYSGVRELTPSP